MNELTHSTAHVETIESADTSIDDLQIVLQHVFSNPDSLRLALTHKSYSNEQSGGQPTVNSDNERLEFLGDAVLDLALSDCIMARFPTDPEGSLSKKRASLVNEETLSKLALEMRLETMIRLGKGEAKTGGLQKPRILASTLEAILGAIYLDGGYEAARNAITQLFRSRLEEFGVSNVDFRGDYKTRLQEKIQETKKSAPTYQVENESGPDHDKQFEVSVRVDDQTLGTGVGKSKKAAEQDAARKALEQLDLALEQAT